MTSPSLNVALTVHLWFWPVLPVTPLKVVLWLLTVQVVEDRKVEFVSLPSLMSFEAAVALETVTLVPFWSRALCQLKPIVALSPGCFGKIGRAWRIVSSPPG